MAAYYLIFYLMTTEALGHCSSHHPWTAMQKTGQENTMLPETSNNMDPEVHAALHLPGDPENQKMHHCNTTYPKHVSSSSTYSNNYPDVDRIRQSFIWAPQTVYEAPFTSKGQLQQQYGTQASKDGLPPGNRNMVTPSSALLYR